MTLSSRPAFLSPPASVLSVPAPAPPVDIFAKKRDNEKQKQREEEKRRIANKNDRIHTRCPPPTSRGGCERYVVPPASLAPHLASPVGVLCRKRGKSERRRMRRRAEKLKHAGAPVGRSCPPIRTGSCFCSRPRWSNPDLFLPVPPCPCPPVVVLNRLR